jgi:DNA-binding transcriptional MocR family regulator
MVGNSMDTDDQSAMIPPRYQRLSDELAEAIHGGRLPVGSRLPSLRQMALQRRLSLNTVIAAYRQLEDAGLVIPRPRPASRCRGCRCRSVRCAIPVGAHRTTAAGADGPRAGSTAPPGVIDLAFAGPRGRQFYPGAQLARHTAQVLRHGQQTVETYARPNGSPRLLAQIVRRGPRMGLHTHSERLLLTHGAMEACSWRCVQSPSPVMRWASRRRPTSTCTRCWPTWACRPSSCPPIRSTGWMWTRWTALLQPLAALVVMPTVHNPLGCTMPTAAKQRLAELVNARQLPLIEDAVYAELQFCEPPAPC